MNIISPKIPVLWNVTPCRMLNSYWSCQGRNLPVFKCLAVQAMEYWTLKTDSASLGRQ